MSRPDQEQATTRDPRRSRVVRQRLIGAWLSPLLAIVAITSCSSDQGVCEDPRSLGYAAECASPGGSGNQDPCQGGFLTDGDPCTGEGSQCGQGDYGPCQNVLVCTKGHWTPTGMQSCSSSACNPPTTILPNGSCPDGTCPVGDQGGAANGCCSAEACALCPVDVSQGMHCPQDGVECRSSVAGCTVVFRCDAQELNQIAIECPPDAAPDGNASDASDASDALSDALLDAGDAPQD